MPEPRTRFAGALLNSHIWVVAGYDNVIGSGVQTALQRYDMTKTLSGCHVNVWRPMCRVSGWHKGLKFVESSKSLCKRMFIFARVIDLALLVLREQAQG